MAYGLSIRAPFRDGTAGEAAKARSPRSPVRSWRRLGEATRLELIEQALLTANNRADGYPLAL